ncbi:hypothetical protein [Candidatus Flexifilum breve]|uniref:hypothetical protein n=1 Tax=Candidatus Flexifilum breve TaxID=3140694 RepID=UPI003312FB9B
MARSQVNELRRIVRHVDPAAFMVRAGRISPMDTASAKPQSTRPTTKIRRYQLPPRRC